MEVEERKWPSGKMALTEEELVKSRMHSRDGGVEKNRRRRGEKE